MGLVHPANFQVSKEFALFSLFRPASDKESSPKERVNRYLSQAITARSIKKDMRDHVNLFTLCFKKSIRERQVSRFILLKKTNKPNLQKEATADLIFWSGGYQK